MAPIVRPERQRRVYDKNMQVANKLLGAFLKILQEDAIPHAKLFLACVIIEKTEFNFGGNMCIFYWKMDEGCAVKKVRVAPWHLQRDNWHHFVGGCSVKIGHGAPSCSS